jgi:hypothetical protein
MPPGMAPSQRPKSSRTAVIVTVVAIVVVLACLSFGTVVFFALRHDDSLDRAESAPATSPTADPDPDPTNRPTDGADPAYGPHKGDIQQFIVDRPSGSQAWTDGPSDQLLDLNAAAADFADTGEGKAALQLYHFKDGYVRRWIDEDKNRTKVRILRFASASDGDNFTNFFIDSNQGGNWGDPQPVPGIDTAAGFVEDTPMGDGFQRSVAVGDAGDIVAIVISDQMPAADPAVPDGELLQEFKRL